MRSVGLDGEVILHEEEREAFLLHVASGRYFGLNESGIVIWNAIVDGVDPVDRLCERWPKRERSLLQNDANVLLDQLLLAGLVATR